MSRSYFSIVVIGLTLLCSKTVMSESVPYLVQSIQPSAAQGFIKLKGPGKIIVDGKNQPYGLGDQVYIATSAINSLSNIDGEQAEFESVKRYSNASDASGLCSIRFQTSHYAETIAVQKMDCAEVLQVIHQSNHQPHSTQ